MENKELPILEIESCSDECPIMGDSGFITTLKEAILNGNMHFNCNSKELHAQNSYKIEAFDDVSEVGYSPNTVAVFWMDLQNNCRRLKHMCVFKKDQPENYMAVEKSDKLIENESESSQKEFIIGIEPVESQTNTAQRGSSLDCTHRLSEAEISTMKMKELEERLGQVMGNETTQTPLNSSKMPSGVFREEPYFIPGAGSLQREAVPEDPIFVVNNYPVDKSLFNVENVLVSEGSSPAESRRVSSASITPTLNTVRNRSTSTLKTDSDNVVIHITIPEKSEFEVVLHKGTTSQVDITKENPKTDIFNLNKTESIEQPKVEVSSTQSPSLSLKSEEIENEIDSSEMPEQGSVQKMIAFFENIRQE